MDERSSAWIPDELYQEVVRFLPLCTVDLVVFNPALTQVLLFLRQNRPLQGEWFSLGGRLLKNETIQECALRQARAEAGLELSPERLVRGPVFDEFFPDSRYGPEFPSHTVNVCLGYVLEQEQIVRLDGQHSSFGWHAIDEQGLHPLLTRKIDAMLPLMRDSGSTAA